MYLPVLKNQGLITEKSNGGSERLLSRSDFNGKGRTGEKKPQNFLPDRAVASLLADQVCWPSDDIGKLRCFQPELQDSLK